MEHREGGDTKPSLVAGVPKKTELLQEGVRGVNSKHPVHSLNACMGQTGRKKTPGKSLTTSLRSSMHLLVTAK
jgi:hypothetical protein